MASTYLQRTFSTGNRKKWTWSAWVKRSKLGANIVLFSSWADTNNNSVIQFLDDDAFRYKDKAAGGTQANLYTNRKFRDTSSWYHIVVVYDSNNSTSGNRIRFYINGVEETSFSTDTMPGQNNDSTVNRNCSHYIGTDDTTGYFFDGCMTHVHFCDGYAYSASDFGETDTTTGEWKAKTSPSVNYGTTGFFILKDGNTITDQSSNSNDFTLGGGTLTDLKDNPDNTFATMNPLIYNPAQANYNPLFSNGNTTTASNTSVNAFSNARATLAMTSGKYYAEFKTTSSDSNMQIGLINYQSGFRSTNNWGLNYQNDGAVSFETNGDIYINNSLSGTSFSGFTTGDIMQVAFDRTSEKVWLGKNGTWFNSGDPSNGTNELLDLSSTINDDEFWTFAVGFYHSVNEVWDANFGNGYFGTTAITTNSGNGYSGAEGSSKFNYTVPTGYSALSTKGLNL